MGRDFPLTGSGLGTFEFVYPGYQDYITDGLVDYAHNDWVQLFAETGGIGLQSSAGDFSGLWGIRLSYGGSAKILSASVSVWEVWEP